MPYYHVLIETIEPSETYYELDKKSLSEFKERVMIPYLKGESFLFDNHRLDQTKVKCIKIRRAEDEFYNYSMVSQPSGFYIDKTEGLYGIFCNDNLTEDITNKIERECKMKIQTETSKTNPTMDKSKVFIVHGHNDAAKSEAARFVESLGFKAIILHEQASLGDTIIEKIEKNSNVGFAIVLYTPCDWGASQGEKDHLNLRARQNVVFEHGYLMAKIGRKNVCPLVKGDIETPNDISGVVYIKMDEGDGWKLAVAKEMKKSGYDVDLNKI
ncbi:MAG: nucleotide-binding protein [Porphyromonadaceae bacterium]|nr:nucleotide-binding protein [Porphyromonadaceae bacterium]